MVVSVCSSVYHLVFKQTMFWVVLMWLGTRHSGVMGLQTQTIRYALLHALPCMASEPPAGKGIFVSQCLSQYYD